MDDLLNRLQTALGEGFVVEREIGRGGMSRVFVATETRLSRRVVVKVLRPEIAAATSTERFEREIALCVRCQHPHIVPLLTSGRVDELPFFTMPFVAGESLRDRLVREGPLPIHDVIRMLGEISDALAYAHRLGVIHRDIKPENILIQDGHAVIADFGVAKAIDKSSRSEGPSPATTAGMVLGTPAYMAPEQATGDPSVDHRIDLYALGVLGYELLTGELPFGDLMPPGLVSAQLTRTPPPVTRHRRECPAPLAALIGRLLARDPAQRPASADAVRRELGALRGPDGRRQIGRQIGAALAIGAFGIIVLLLVRDRPPSSGGSGAIATKSLAVLPFQSIGGDSTTNYFGQGIAEELISALGRLGGLRVASRTSAFAARAASADLRSIGQRLGVAAVMEGTVQQIGSRVRVSARLVDVGQEAQLWSGEYRSELKDVFEVQDSIARAIAKALQVALTALGGGSTNLVERGTTDQEAHDQYLRGRYFLAQRTAASGRRAIEAFHSALARDSTYALALSGLADAYALLVPFGNMSPSEAYPLARAAAERAVQFDSTRAEVHTSLGFIAMWYRRDLNEAERHFDRALQLNPSYVQAHLFRAWQLMVTGRIHDGLEEIERARTLDPLSLIVNTRKGTLLHFAGRDREALEAFRYALELDSTFANARAGLALSLAMLGRCQEALSTPVPVEPMLGTNEGGTAGVVFARCGRSAEARRILAQLDQWRRTRYVAADALASVYASLGDTDAALSEVQRAADERAFTALLLELEPIYAPIRTDPRWEPLVRRVGLPAEWSRRMRPERDGARQGDSPPITTNN